MRAAVDRERILGLVAALGRQTSEETTLYLAGGATAVLHGWRSSTLDVDVRVEPERDEFFKAIERLKDEHTVSIELASPIDFLPELPDWRERSAFVAHERALTIRNLDLYSQALAKVERDHEVDRSDVQAMLDRQLIDRARLLELYESIEPQLYRFPAVHVPSLRARVEAVTRGSP